MPTSPGAPAPRPLIAAARATARGSPRLPYRAKALAESRINHVAANAARVASNVQASAGAALTQRHFTVAALRHGLDRQGASEEPPRIKRAVSTCGIGKSNIYRPINARTLPGQSMPAAAYSGRPALHACRTAKWRPTSAAATL